MKYIKPFALFETLKSYDMVTARKVLLAEFKNLGITDVRISIDDDLYSGEFSYMKDEYDKRIAKGEKRNDILDKLILVTFGGKTGDNKIVLDNIDKVLYAFDKIGWFPASVNYEYGNWTPPKGPKGAGVGEIRKEETDMSKLKMPDDTHYIHFALDPIYDDKIESKNRIFYHVTKKEIADKIMKEGLLPKSKSKRSYYPQRIFMSKTLQGAEDILPQLKREDNGEYVILKVVIPENIDIYKDTRYKQEGVYVLDPIRPDNIELIEPTELKQAA